MFPTISLGPLVLPAKGLVFILGAWVVLSLIERSAKSLKLNAEATYTLSSVALVAGFIGARLVFVGLHWSAYRNDLLAVAWPITSGFDIWGGLFFGLAAALLYGRAQALPPADTLDAIMPGLLAALMIVSLADFLGGPGYGEETVMPWGVDVYGIRRHPVQLYEILAGVTGLGIWWRLRRQRAFAGQLFLAAAAVYAAGRLLADTYRANAWLSSGGIHLLQVVSLLVLLTCLFLLGREMTVVDRQEAADELARD